MRTLIALCLIVLSYCCQADSEYPVFTSAEQEKNYQVLISELRCLVCQNQNIAESNADLAKDLRKQVYEMLQQGQTPSQILKFMTDRYGEFVLYKPAFTLKTALLWLAPLILISLAMLALWGLFKHQSRKPEQSLNLSADLNTHHQIVPPLENDRWIIGLLILIIPVVSGFLYLELGDINAQQKIQIQEQVMTLKAQIPGLTDYLQLHPEDTQAWLILGKTYLLLNDFNKAAQIFEKLHQLQPDDPEITSQYSKLMAESR